MAQERPPDDEEEEGTFSKACRQKVNKYAEFVMKVQKQIKEACNKAVEDQNEEECDKAAVDQEVIETPMMMVAHLIQIFLGHQSRAKKVT